MRACVCGRMRVCIRERMTLQTCFGEVKSTTDGTLLTKPLLDNTPWLGLYRPRHSERKNYQHNVRSKYRTEVMSDISTLTRRACSPQCMFNLWSSFLCRVVVKSLTIDVG